MQIIGDLLLSLDVRRASSINILFSELTCVLGQSLPNVLIYQNVQLILPVTCSISETPPPPYEKVLDSHWLSVNEFSTLECVVFKHGLRLIYDFKVIN